jgi:energy-coupling factor transporter ATP-binding protein EcfA2
VTPEMAGREIIIRVCNLIVGFGSKLIIQDLALEVYRGEVVGCVGGSGTGKSVLMRTTLGLVRKQSRLIEPKINKTIVIVASANSSPVTGNIVDVWQAALEDVGPAGVDEGKGAQCPAVPAPLRFWMTRFANFCSATPETVRNERRLGSHWPW